MITGYPGKEGEGGLDRREGVSRTVGPREHECGGDLVQASFEERQDVSTTT